MFRGRSKPPGRGAGSGGPRRVARKLTDVYLPKHFAARDRAAVEAFVDGVGAADLVTFDGTKPIASLIPAQIRDCSGQTALGRLLGHLALQNPQWRSVAPDTLALAIVHGPQAYVSPGWYPSTARHGKVVPTWNYVSVHFTGPVTIHRDAEWLRDLVGRGPPGTRPGGPRRGTSATRHRTSSTGSCGRSSGSKWRSRRWRPRRN